MSDELKRLDRLVGTWEVSGGAIGTTTYEWMDGGHFLIQRGLLEQHGHQVRFTEMIGHEHKFGEEPGTDIQSRVYDAEGNTLDYVYELEGDVLTIWGGFKGSPAYFRGTFSTDGDRLAGDWVYPGGGGYQATLVRRAS
ncbi:hypothetical protein ACGFIF_16055 [Kribbella sp. NPDC049174]|uniref:hypothetical protein n=1 Tax=Kribbella sp. NPDC049174 TaxID=3364112 RepID=UPI003712F0D0